MKMSSRDQMILAVVLIVAVAVLATAFLLYPQFSVLAGLDQQMNTASQSLAEAQASLARRQSAKAQAAATQAQLLRLYGQMPDTPQLPALIIDLQDTADEAGIAIDKVTVAKPASAGSYSKLAMNLTAAGAWTDLIDYFRRLNEMDRSVRVLSVALGRASEPTGSVDPTVTASVQLEAYMLNKTTSGAQSVPGAPSPGAQSVPGAPSPGAQSVPGAPSRTP